MKKVTFSVSLLFSIVAYSQVGIGTHDPQQMLHIDAKQDNKRIDLTSEQRKSNDIFITEESKVGIGYSDFTPSSRFEAKVTIESGENGKSGLKFTNLDSTQPNYNGDALPLAVTAVTAIDGIDFPVGSVVPSANCIPEYYSAKFFSEGTAIAINPNYPYYNHKHDSVEQNGITYNSGVNTRINLTVKDKVLTNKISAIPTPGTGTFTLKKGNTYRLEAGIYNSGVLFDCLDISCSGILEYEWVDYNTNSRIAAQGYTYNNNVSSSGGIQSLALAHYTPSVDTLVALKSLTATTGIWPSHSYFLLQQVNPCN